MFKTDFNTVLFRAFSGFLQFSVTDIRSGDAVSKSCQPDCLCSDPAGTVKDTCRWIKTVLMKDPIEYDSLLLCCGLPILKKLVILRSHVIIKCLSNIHADLPAKITGCEALKTHMLIFAALVTSQNSSTSFYTITRDFSR